MRFAARDRTTPGVKARPLSSRTHVPPGMGNEIKVTPVQSDYWKKEYFAERPVSERLINKKLELRGLNVMRDWRICLEEYIKEYYQGYLD